MHEGYSLRRRLVMYNDFVLIGQRSAPADTAGSDMVVALERIAGRRCGKWSCKIHKPT